MTSQQIRSIVLTSSVAAIAVTGAWYGAGLKTEKQKKEVVQRRREATPAEQIALLEQTKGALVAKRIGLEKKIHELEMRAQGATRQESMVGRERKR